MHVKSVYKRSSVCSLQRGIDTGETFPGVFPARFRQPAFRNVEHPFNTPHAYRWEVLLLQNVRCEERKGNQCSA